MRIMVTVKSVAKLGDGPVFREDNLDVESEGLDYDLNEWDDYSIGEAVKLKESAEEVEVVAVCVGGDHADDALVQCLAKGADRAIRVWDEALEAYSSPLTIARVLATVAQDEEPDLLLSSVQSNDQVFSSTGTALAAYLGWPHSTAVSKIEWTPGDETATITRGLEAGMSEKLRIQCPAVLVTQSGVNALRYPTLRDVKQARKKPLDVFSLPDLGLEEGLGEPEFRVRRMFVPEKLGQAQIIEGTKDQQAARLLEIINEVKGG